MNTSSPLPPNAGTPADSPLQPPGRGPGFWIGVGGGLGLLKPAPGTWGSLLGLPLGWGLSQLSPAVGAIAWLAMLAAAWASCRRTCEVLGSKDPGQFVADEYVALAGVYLLIPFDWRTAVAGFLLFRLFDIWKPWPVRALDRVGGTAGVMTDDLAAAGYALACLWLLGAMSVPS